MKRLLFVFTLIGFSLQAQAGFLLELGGTYISDSLTTSPATSSSKMFYQIGGLFNYQKTIWGGWNYSSISQSDSGSEKIVFASTDTGPYFKWQFGKHAIFNFSLAYNILSRATYKIDSGESESWQGTSYWIQLGVLPEVKNGLRVGASLNYYSASYTKKTVNSVESSASNSKTWIFPMLSLTKQW